MMHNDAELLAAALVQQQEEMQIMFKECAPSNRDHGPTTRLWRSQALTEHSNV